MDSKRGGQSAVSPFSLANSLEAEKSSSLEYFSTKAQTFSNNGPLIPPTSSPIDNVPNEIISYILEVAYFSEQPPDESLRAPIARTCSRFQEIVHSTPALWSTYHLTPGNVGRYLPRLAHYLCLSREHPLDIHLNSFWPLETTRSLMALFLPQSHRWRHLTIVTPNPEIFSFLVDIPAPMLKTISISHFSSQRRLSLGHAAFGGHLPSLTSLSLRNVNLDGLNVPLRHLTRLEFCGYGTWPEFEGLEEILGGSETLEELVLHVKPTLVLQDVHAYASSIYLPALRSLTVLTSEWLTEDIARLVRLFCAPNIETLVVRDEGGRPTAPLAVEPLRYSTVPTPRLKIAKSEIDVACRCLTVQQLGELRVLELDKAIWPGVGTLARTFRDMGRLEKLVLADVHLSSVLQSLGGEERVVGVPTLRVLDVKPIAETARQGLLVDLMRLFAMPGLEELVLRRVSEVNWEHFKRDEYPRLSSLTLAGMSTLGRHDPLSAFPGIRHLSLLDSNSNAIIERMIERGGMGWHDLESLEICGDRSLSEYLLCIALEARERCGSRLGSLIVDQATFGKMQRRGVIEEHVGQVIVVDYD